MSLSTFVSTVRKAVKSSAESADEVISSLKKPNTGIKSFDDAFGSLNFTSTAKGISVNGTPLRVLEKALRRGEIIKLFKSIDKTHTITYADELRFRKLVDTPDLKLRELEETFTTAKVLHPDLDVIVNKLGKTDAPLTTASKVKINNMMESLIKAKLTTTTKVGAVITGLTATIVIGTDYYKSLVEATAARNGVYVLVTINNKTTSYKLTSKSCQNQTLPKGSLAFSGHLELDNAALYLLYVINGTDAVEKTKVQTLLDGVAPTMETFESILSNDVQFQKIHEYYYSSSYSGPKNINDPCRYLHENLKSDLPCIGWDTSASVNSLTYTSAAVLPDNMALTCITNSSMLETLVAAAGDVAHAIIGSNFSTKLIGYFKYFGIAVFVVALIAVIRIIIIKYRQYIKTRDAPEYEPLLNSNDNMEVDL